MDAETEQMEELGALEQAEVGDILSSISAKGTVSSIEKQREGMVEIRIRCSSINSINRNAMLETVQPEKRNVYVIYGGNKGTEYNVVMERRNRWKREVEQDEQMTGMAISEVGEL